MVLNGYFRWSVAYNLHFVWRSRDVNSNRSTHIDFVESENVSWMLCGVVRMLFSAFYEVSLENFCGTTTFELLLSFEWSNSLRWWRLLFFFWRRQRPRQASCARANVHMKLSFYFVANFRVLVVCCGKVNESHSNNNNNCNEHDHRKSLQRQNVQIFNTVSVVEDLLVGCLPSLQFQSESLSINFEQKIYSDRNPLIKIGSSQLTIK